MKKRNLRRSDGSDADLMVGRAWSHADHCPVRGVVYLMVVYGIFILSSMIFVFISTGMLLVSATSALSRWPHLPLKEGASSETEKVTPRKGRGERNQQTAALELECVEGYCGDTDASYEMAGLDVRITSAYVRHFIHLRSVMPCCAKGVFPKDFIVHSLPN